MKKLFSFLLFSILSFSSFSFGQNTHANSIDFVPYTVGTLPSASLNNGRTYQITDGLTGTDCTTGGGSQTLFCRSNGTTYISAPSQSGSGTVTSVSVVTANGVSGSVATATTTPAITLTLGAITPTSVTSQEYNDCDDVSGSGTVQSCTTATTFAPIAGSCIIYSTTTSNTGDVTVNVNSLGAKHFRKWLGAAVLASGDMPANTEVLACYDGTYWEVSSIGNAPAGGTVTTTGSPASPNLAAFSGAASITNATAHNVSVPLTCAAASASGTAYTCTTAPSFTPADGDVILFQADVASGTSPTLNVNSTSAAPMQKNLNGSLVAIVVNDFVAGGDYLAEFDGTNWQLQGNLGTALYQGSTAGTFPILNQNTTGSAATWTTARNLAGNSVNGSANVAFANAFIVQGTSDTGLSGAQFLGALGTGLLKNTTTTGVLSIGGSADILAVCTTCVTSAASLTSTALMTGAGSQGSQTPSAASTLSAAGALSLPSTVTTGTNGGTGGSVTLNGSSSGSSAITVSSTGVLALPSGTTATNMALTTPTLGTPASGTLTNATGLPLNGVVSATGAIATIADGNNPLIINCALTSGTTCLTTGETTAATTAGAVEEQITTLTTSTAIPVQITMGANGPAAANAPAVLNISAAAAGGLASASVNGFTGAFINLKTGAGSAGGGTAGNGGTGGAFTVALGGGGAAGGSTANTGGVGGSYSFTPGAGATGASTGAGGAAGTTTFAAAAGGNAGATSGTGGAGSDFLVTTGAGGTAAVASNTGRGGNAVFTLGSAGGTGTAGTPGNFQIAAGTLAGSQTTAFLNLTGTWNTTGVVDAGIFENITNTASGTGASLLDLQASTVSQLSVKEQAANSFALGPNLALGGTAPEITLGGTTPYLNMQALVNEGVSTCHIASAITLTTQTTICTWILPAAAKIWSYQCLGSYSTTTTAISLTLGNIFAQSPSTGYADATIFTGLAGTSTSGGATNTGSTAVTILAGSSVASATNNVPWSVSGTFTGSATSGTFILYGTASTTSDITIRGNCTLQ